MIAQDRFPTLALKLEHRIQRQRQPTSVFLCQACRVLQANSGFGHRFIIFHPSLLCLSQRFNARDHLRGSSPPLAQPLIPNPSKPLQVSSVCRDQDLKLQEVNSYFTVSSTDSHLRVSLRPPLAEPLHLYQPEPSITHSNTKMISAVRKQMSKGRPPIPVCS